MSLNKHHFIARNMLVSGTVTFVALFTIALFATLFINFAGILFGAFSSSASAATYEASITTSGTVNLDVTASGNGANVTTDSVNIVSTCPAGYTVSIAAKSATNSSFNDTTLYKDGNKNNTANTKKIPASTGTKTNPVSILGSNINTWGYTTEAGATINSNFIGLTNNLVELTTSTTPTTSEGTTLPVYYGVSVDNTIEPGTYKMSDDAVITYYLTTSLDCTSYQVAFNPTSTAGGQTISGTGTMGNQRIAEGTPTNLDANAFTAPSGYTFKEWNTAQDGTGIAYANQQQVTDLTTVGNTVTLYAQWTDCPAGNICYNDNGANSTTTMGKQTVGSSATTVDLWASNYQRSGYGFAGWSTKPITVSTKVNIPAGVTAYGPNETINDATTVANIKANGLKLYAIWVAPEQDPNTGQPMTLQSFGACSSLRTGDVVALKDARDNNTYAVAKLADGNCWMIENLRLADKKPDNTPITISSTNTNSPISTFTQLGASIDPTQTAWCTTSFSACLDQSMLYTGNTTSLVANMTSTNANIYSYGNYYNWYSVTAGNGTYSTRGGVNGDICPTGWHLPYGGSGTGTKGGNTSGGFYYLGDKLGATAPSAASSEIWRSYPQNFVYSGRVYGSSVEERGSGGYVWPSTAGDLSVAYSLAFGSTGVNPGTIYWSKYLGFVARCMVSGS